MTIMDFMKKWKYSPYDCRALIQSRPLKIWTIEDSKRLVEECHFSDDQINLWHPLFKDTMKVAEANKYRIYTDGKKIPKFVDKTKAEERYHLKDICDNIMNYYSIPYLLFVKALHELYSLDYQYVARTFTSYGYPEIAKEVLRLEYDVHFVQN